MAKSRKSPVAAPATFALTTSRPLVRRIGLGGRIAQEMVQPVYVLNGVLVANKRGRLIPVQVVDATTVTMDITGATQPVAEVDCPRKDLAAHLAAIGAVVFKPTVQAQPAKPAKAAKATTAQPAKPAEPSGIVGIVQAITGLSDADKAALKAALLAGL